MGKNLEKRINAKQIAINAGMCGRPEYYSGRGAVTCDLNDKILEKFYQGIQKEYGKKAAKQFVQMVADVPKLSATDFLLTLYRLEGQSWKWDKKLIGDEKGVYVDGPTDEVKRAIGLATIGGIIFGDNSRDKTGYIKGEFLRRHGIKTPKSTIFYEDGVNCFVSV
ncbi:MAG: hypothetical protein Q8O84_01625 [Nanoarchaeota archaeon]|nr:hypothetical protein [Nanoarchaeota archaeon]